MTGRQGLDHRAGARADVEQTARPWMRRGVDEDGGDLGRHSVPNLPIDPHDVGRTYDYAEHALSAGGDALAAAFVECQVGEGDTAAVLSGVGRDANIVTASLKAVASAVNRAHC